MRQSSTYDRKQASPETVYGRLARLGEEIASREGRTQRVMRPTRTPFPEADQITFRAQLARACRVLAVPLVLGLSVRLVLMPFTSWAKDDSVWWLAAANGFQHVGLYQRVGFSYPPLWGYLLQGLGWAMQHLGASVGFLGSPDLRLEPATGAGEFSIVITSLGFNLCFKALLLIFDLGTGLLIYEMCRRATSDERRARFAFCLWFLNPLVVFETGTFGAFDVIVSFSVLCAVVLLIAGRQGWTGVALGVAIMAKGSPAFLIPFFVFVAFDQAQDALLPRLKAVFPLVAGLLGTVALLAVPLWASGQVDAALGSVFGRTGVVQAGGYSIFGLFAFRGLAGAGNAVEGWSGLGTAVLGVQLLIGVALGALGVRKARRDMAFGALSTTVMVLVIVVVLGPLATPQYALWFLPELIILVALWRRGTAGLVIFSAVPMLSLLSLYGPAVLVTPLVAHSWINADSINRIVIGWTLGPVLPWSSAQGSMNFEGPLTVLALCGLLVAMRSLLWKPTPRRRRTVELLGTTAKGVAPSLCALLVVALLGGGLTAEAQRGASVRVAAAVAGRGTEVTAAVQPGASLQQLRLLEFPASTTRLPRTVDVYVDVSYPVVASTTETVENSGADITNGLRLRGFHGEVHTVDAQQLAAVLRSRTSASSTVLVDMSGIFPANVFSKQRDLVSPWLHAGGTLYWGGAPIGYFSGRPGEGDNLASYAGSLGAAGTGRFVNPALLRTMLAPFAVGTRPLPPTSALGLSYRFNGSAPPITPAAAGVEPIGWSSRGRSSLTVLQEGAGTVILFGGPVYNERIVAPDVVLMVLSGITASPGPFSAATVPQAVVRDGGVLRWTAPPPPAGTRAVVVAFDPGVSGLAFERVVAS